MRNDLHNNVTQKVALNSAAISSNTTTDGAIIDLQGYNACEFVIQSATLTDGTYTPLIEEGNDAGLSDAATVSTANTFGTIAAATFVSTDDNVAKRIGYRVGSFRYVRLSLVTTGVTTGGTIGAVAVLGTPNEAPTAA